MSGRLFTEYFLETGILETGPWRSLDDTSFIKIREELRTVFKDLSDIIELNEDVTQEKIIIPVIRLLGWEGYLTEQAAGGHGRSDVPDILLFPGKDAETTALQDKKEGARYKHGVAFIECKSWHRTLDRPDQKDKTDDRTPSTQMLRYLSRVEAASERAIQWGILTNGRLWRLYWQGAQSRSEQFFEIDLPQLLRMSWLGAELSDHDHEWLDHYLRVFILMFRPEAFSPVPGDVEGRTFHRIALDEGKFWEERVSQELGQVVFDHVFPDLIRAIVRNDPQAPIPLNDVYLSSVRDGALTWLYRMLFILYAEQRNLLPIYDKPYKDYSFMNIRKDIAEKIDRGSGFSESSTRYDSHLKDLFRALAFGDSSIGIPPYNGGLFEPGNHPELETIHLPDSIMAALIDQLSRQDENGARWWINYRDLSVQHLGSIYERLLEYTATTDEHGYIVVRPNIFARRVSGSYYTHDELVKLIIESTMGPLIEERMQSFHEKSEQLRKERRAKDLKIKELKEYDPGSKILELRICDPAMGSGHFLMALVDYLADQVLQCMTDVHEEVAWARADYPYHSPLAGRIKEIRDHILESAQQNTWRIDRDQLDDRHIVRRMVLKRMIFGVDKNPMAVELAKVALWLHTFTVGAPLSFLDHHLRCGDSLFGEWVLNVDQLIRQNGELLQHRTLAHIKNASSAMGKIAKLTDADIAEVKLSKTLFREMEKTINPLRHLHDFWCALHWMNAGSGNNNQKLMNTHPGLDPLLNGIFGDIQDVLQAGSVSLDQKEPLKRKYAEIVNDLLCKTGEIAEREKFFHWEIAFPNVWGNLLQPLPDGGFDAIISNPPWDRMKLQDVEWFTDHKPEIAAAARAADRKKMIQELQKKNDPLWQEYLAARERAETAAALARKNKDYPMLSGGDTNLYSLFLERAARLINPQGIIGLLTPSGIAADKSASEFFRYIAASGRLKALYDFENKKFFFPDVDSRFKFCTFLFGGKERKFKQTDFAFFLHSRYDLKDEGRHFFLGPRDFDLVNPNTGTAPVFRCRRDAQITTAIYKRFPVLVDRRGGEEKKLWPVRYSRMFDMTNDSHLFKTAGELDKEGFYPIKGKKWKKGSELYVPLYEGKMVQAYDHRAASVIIHPENIHRPAQPESSTPENHKNPEWLPMPLYWIPLEKVDKLKSLDWAIGFKHVTAPTNVRSMIAAIIPLYGAGNSLPLLLPENEKCISYYKNYAPIVLANINSFVFDYFLRQKVQGQNLNLYIMEQLPFVPMESFEKKIKNKKLEEFIRKHVLQLTYTSTDLIGFARDQGYKGKQYLWDEEDRLHRMCRLDALFFNLYGLGRDDAGYILDQFPIVKREDEERRGKYLTKELILAYMNAVEAGDLETIMEI